MTDLAEDVDTVDVARAASVALSYECSRCAARFPKPFLRCLSCSAINTGAPSVFRAPKRRKPENVWGHHDASPGFDPQAGMGAPYSGFGAAPDPEPATSEEVEEVSDEVVAEAKNLDDVEPSDDTRLPSGHVLLDRMTVGGPVVATASGITAFPGVGKSTLLLEGAYAYRSKGLKTVILALEEPSAKVSRRARRIEVASRFPPLISKKTGKPRGWVKIVSPYDPVEGETSKERAARLEKGFDLAAILNGLKYEPDILILDSASRCHSPKIGDKMGSPRQLKEAGQVFYERCQGAGRFADKKPCVGFVILQSTKEGDSAVPQSFTHAVDATYIGEHVMVHEGKVVSCPDQKKPVRDPLRPKEGYIAFRSHGKNRDGDVYEVAYARMTAKGLVPVEEAEIVEAFAGFNAASAEETAPSAFVEGLDGESFSGSPRLRAKKRVR